MNIINLCNNPYYYHITLNYIIHYLYFIILSHCFNYFTLHNDI